MSEPGFFEAYYGTWVPLKSGAGVIDLLTRMYATGVLDDLRQPCSADVVAVQMEVAPDAARALLEVLHLHDVVRADDDHYLLTPPWMALTAPGAAVRLSSLLAGRDATGVVLRRLGERDYWELSAEDRIALARAVSFDPYSDALVDAYRAQLAADPRAAAMLDGGRLLELGCGVAGRALLTLRAVPSLAAVGVELSADLAAEAERRARELGLDDRFTVVCGDAATYRSSEPFDFGYWSQFFFPEEARPAALRTLYASLRPGASFQAPIAVDPAAATLDPNVARDEAMMTLMLRAWGVPERDADSLVAEVTAAGFVDVTVVPREPVATIWARRP